MKNKKLKLNDFDLLEFVLRAGPALGMVAPAWMMYSKGVELFGFPPVVAGAIGVGVELIGYFGVDTSLLIWTHNRKYSTKKNQVPMWIPIAAYGFYLALLTVVVVLTEVVEGKAWLANLGRALLVWLGAPGAVLMAVRSERARIVDGNKRRRAQPAVSTVNPAPKLSHKCAGCGQGFRNQQGLAAHLRHHPECKPVED